MKTYFDYIAFFIIAFSACQQKSVRNPENVFEVSRDGINYSIKVAPKDSMTSVVLFVKTDQNTSNIYDYLSATSINKPDLEYYFSYGIKKDVALRSGSREFLPVISHYEKSFGIRKTETFNFLFDFIISDFSEDELVFFWDPALPELKSLTLSLPFEYSINVNEINTNHES